MVHTCSLQPLRGMLRRRGPARHWKKSTITPSSSSPPCECASLLPNRIQHNCMPKYLIHDITLLHGVYSSRCPDKRNKHSSQQTSPPLAEPCSSFNYQPHAIVDKQDEWLIVLHYSPLNNLPEKHLVVENVPLRWLGIILYSAILWLSFPRFCTSSAELRLRIVCSKWKRLFSTLSQARNIRIFRPLMVGECPSGSI